LSRNRFTEIPPDVWQFAPLETLNLYHNCIKSIPEAIKNLQMLTYLNIRWACFSSPGFATERLLAQEDYKNICCSLLQAGQRLPEDKHV
ncbi:hypothetical protein E2320_013147, partial [Naja naja]